VVEISLGNIYLNFPNLKSEKLKNTEIAEKPAEK
jgi:hypothetical protein